MVLVYQTTTIESIPDVIRERAASSNVQETYLAIGDQHFFDVPILSHHQSTAALSSSGAAVSHHTPPINEVNRCATLKLDVLTETSPPKVSLEYAVRCPTPSVTEHTLPRLPVFLQLSQPLDF